MITHHCVSVCSKHWPGFAKSECKSKCDKMWSGFYVGRGYLCFGLEGLMVCELHVKRWAALWQVVVVKLSKCVLDSSSWKRSPRKLYQRSFMWRNLERWSRPSSLWNKSSHREALSKVTERWLQPTLMVVILKNFSPWEKLILFNPKLSGDPRVSGKRLISSVFFRLSSGAAPRGRETLDFDGPVGLWRMKPQHTHLPSLFSICQSCPLSF